MTELIEYFNGDELASNVWVDKYQERDFNDVATEALPSDMHRRMAKPFSKVEKFYQEKENIEQYEKLSGFGKSLIDRRASQTIDEIEEEIFNYLDRFNWIVPQGSIMSILGNRFKVGSLSNCFVIPPPQDSYGGIMKSDEHLVQLMKRRGGVGTNLNNLRPTKARVTNSAGTSTGVPSFAERYSNSTREVAQDGRRGALMLLLLCLHPDIFNFVKMKDDRTKVTGANVSTMLTNKFMKAVETDDIFLCRFPVDIPDGEAQEILMGLGYDWRSDFEIGKMYSFNVATVKGGKFYTMVINARELFDLIIEMAWKNAEPGIAFIDRVLDYSPEGVYEMYKAIACNPCGEQWLQAFDSCRLFAMNFFSIVSDPFTPQAKVDFEKLYEVAYMQQRLADDLVDLELQYITKIIEKIHADPEEDDVKQVELSLWENVYAATASGRRTGCGFTGLGDMLAALGLKYDSPEAMKMIDKVMYMKMAAELDCTIDMGILRGTFSGWSHVAEYPNIGGGLMQANETTKDSKEHKFAFIYGNSFYKMLWEDFPEQAMRMLRYGRRNVSWSTVAPTGTVSIMTQTTSGLEPLFEPYYIRNKKVNPNDKNVRVDYTDQNGDAWQEYYVLHPKFEQWLTQVLGSNDVYIPVHELKLWFEKSPWYGSTANDIDWVKRVEIQGIIQKYTTNAVSSTINLPKDVSKEEVGRIYHAAYHAGLKGITVYRDGSRTGVLVTESNKATTDEFGYHQAPKRPKELEADYYFATSKGVKYAVIVGLLNGKPYEIFAFEDPVKQEHCHGRIIKVKKGVYSFVSSDYTIENLQLSSEQNDERLLTRWVSTLLRHGANPKFVIEQTEKSEVQITSFAKVISRVLKKYLPDGDETNTPCPECKQDTMVYQEGCKSCKNCGYSAC